MWRFGQKHQEQASELFEDKLTASKFTQNSGGSSGCMLFISRSFTYLNKPYGPSSILILNFRWAKRGPARADGVLSILGTQSSHQVVGMPICFCMSLSLSLALAWERSVREWLGISYFWCLFYSRLVTFSQSPDLTKSKCDSLSVVLVLLFFWVFLCLLVPMKLFLSLLFLFLLFSVQRLRRFQELVASRTVQKRHRNLPFALFGVFYCYIASPLSLGT